MRRTQSILVAVLAAVLAVACTPDTPFVPAPTTPEASLLGTNPGKRVVPAKSANAYRVAKKIGKNGGIIDTGRGHLLSFPAGALPDSAEVEISIERIEGTTIQFELTPHGLVFPEGAEPVLTLSFALAESPNLASLAIVYLDANGTILEILPTQVDLLTQSASARLRHFSRYAIAD